MKPNSTFGEKQTWARHICATNYPTTSQLTTALQWKTFFNALNDSYKLIVFDEFHGQQPITFMNQILDGQKMQIPQKGTMYYKQNNPAIIILSNMPPENCYHGVVQNHPAVFAAFLRRLCVVKITQQMHFDL